MENQDLKQEQSWSRGEEPQLTDETQSSPADSAPLPRLRLPPGALEEVTLDDVIAAGTRADRRLPRSVLNTQPQQIIRATLAVPMLS